MTQWLTDDIDFSAYEQETEVRQRVLPASAFTDEVIAYFWDEKSDRGATTPWAKLGDKIRDADTSRFDLLADLRQRLLINE